MFSDRQGYRNMIEDKEVADNEIQSVWSFWKTIGITFFIITVGNFFLQFLVMGANLIPAFFQNGHFSFNSSTFKDTMGEVVQKSFVISESILVSDFVSVLVILYFVRKKNREQMKSYLGFNPVRVIPFVIWQAIMVAAFFGMNYIVSQTSIEEPDFMKFMRDILKTDSVAGLVLMLMALVVAAPLFEELLFRGFMYTGMIRSRAGIIGAIIIPSIMWALVHVQYEWLWISMIFFMGILFTLARHMSGSIYTVIGMHAVNNFLSFIDILRS